MGFMSSDGFALSAYAFASVSIFGAKDYDTRLGSIRSADAIALRHTVAKASLFNNRDFFRVSLWFV